LNYLALPLVNLDSKQVARMPLAAKVREVFKALNITITGPIWQLIFKAAMVMVNKA